MQASLARSTATTTGEQFPPSVGGGTLAQAPLRWPSACVMAWGAAPRAPVEAADWLATGGPRTRAESRARRVAAVGGGPGGGRR